MIPFRGNCQAGTKRKPTLATRERRKVAWTQKSKGRVICDFRRVIKEKREEENEKKKSTHSSIDLLWLLSDSREAATDVFFAQNTQIAFCESLLGKLIN